MFEIVASVAAVLSLINLMIMPIVIGKLFFSTHEVRFTPLEDIEKINQAYARGGATEESEPLPPEEHFAAKDMQEHIKAVTETMFSEKGVVEDEPLQ